MCCGSRRSAWRAASASATRSTTSPTARQAFAAAVATAPGPVSGRSAFPAVSLQYAETPEIRVRGAVTGRAYRFSGAEPVQAVDARDAAVLLRNSAFRRSGR